MMYVFLPDAREGENLEFLSIVVRAYGCRFHRGRDPIRGGRHLHSFSRAM